MISLTEESKQFELDRNVRSYGAITTHDPVLSIAASLRQIETVQLLISEL